MIFIEKIRKRWQDRNTKLCGGLDSDRDFIPKHIHAFSPVLEFNKSIIDSTNSFVCAYKINIAFYSSDSGGQIYPPGEYNLKKTIDYIHERYPDIPVILDSKRGDIGNTTEHYAKEAFERFGADAVIVNPFFGQDALQPFLDYKDKGIFILCKTSNAGSNEFQNLLVYSEEFDRKLGVWIRETPIPFYCRVAERVAKHWNKNKNCCLVVGATYPNELAMVRHIVGDDMLILVPGVGKQGGDLGKVIKAGKKNLIINAGGSVLYASSRTDFTGAARKEIIKLQKEVNDYLLQQEA